MRVFFFLRGGGRFFYILELGLKKCVRGIQNILLTVRIDFKGGKGLNDITSAFFF